MKFVFVFFFSSRRRHTRFKCDWSSDVCSSDLPPQQNNLVIGGYNTESGFVNTGLTLPSGAQTGGAGVGRAAGGGKGEILGGGGSLKKKKKTNIIGSVLMSRDGIVAPVRHAE